MSYISLYFFLFFVVILAAFYVVPTKYREIVLLSANMIFYLSFDIRYIIFLLLVAGSSFYIAKLIKDTSKNHKNLLILVILFNVLMWGTIKWGRYFIGIISEGILEHIGIYWLVPIGISYYTLEAISYVVDVYMKKIEPEKSFFKYLVYISYFPKIVQGPITKYNEIVLNHHKPLKEIDVKTNISLIAVGFVKKLVVADRLAIFVNYCFDNYDVLDGGVLYIGAVCYSIQLYLDFSGCVDICRGFSGLLGIHLKDNFNCPYFSKSIKEFWGKWHISFSTWLKEYIYIPLGGNRKGKNRKYINIMLTFIVSGIWHGASLSFLVWGLLHGLYQVLGEVTNKIRARIKKALLIDENSISDNIYKIVITFNLVTFAWIFFRASGTKIALLYIKNIFTNLSPAVLFSEGLLYSNIGSYGAVFVVIVNIFLIGTVEFYKLKGKNIVEEIHNLHIFLRILIYALVTFEIIVFGVFGSGYDASAFLYGGF